VLSGEHGIGLEKREFMPYMFTKEEMDLMFKVRKVFDPELKNNPDKIFPIRVCKEC
jgi:FAD/FMN-containing dehydrogenase